MNVSDFKNIMWDYTRKISESMSNAFCPVCEHYGLTMLQVRILVELYRCDSHTVGSLADSTSVAGANVSAMCKKLEGRGLLERLRNQDDERVVKIALTQMGQGIVLEIDTSLNEKFLQQMEGESEETLDDIILGLKKLDTLLQKISKA
jgi:DNA-binding MarR family transcriptional regulator